MDGAGLTPLHWSALFLNVEAIETLVSHGADIQRYTKYNHLTPLHFWSLGLQEQSTDYGTRICHRWHIDKSLEEMKTCLVRLLKAGANTKADAPVSQELDHDLEILLCRIGQNKKPFGGLVADADAVVSQGLVDILDIPLCSIWTNTKHLGRLMAIVEVHSRVHFNMKHRGDHIPSELAWATAGTAGVERFRAAFKDCQLDVELDEFGSIIEPEFFDAKENLGEHLYE
ncbi:MAG: hypothetical protein LQ340_005303 [Diploschistes diacapsis]|nr:MAG: hypothetical protein LQ340_005303 [Diploschistes diacapsis]